MNENKRISDQLNLPIVRSEVNFLIFPFFCLAKSDLSSTTSIEYHSTIQRDGQKIDISWEVLAHPKFGFPGPFDKDVQKAIEALITHRGFPVVNPIPFSTYHICKIMGINHRSGKNNQSVKDALLRLASTSVHSKQAFYSKANKTGVEELFHLYDYVIFKDKPRPDTHQIADTNYLFLGKWYLDNLNSFYIKHLDYDFYKSLASPIEKRYYEIMSVKFHGSFRSRTPFLRYRYSTLCSLFPLARQPYLSLTKQQLNPSHRRLIKQGFFSKVTWHKTTEKRDWLLYFHPGIRANELLNPERHIDCTEIDSLGTFDKDNGQMKFSFESGDTEHSQNSQDKYYKFYSKDNNKEPKSENETQLDQTVVALLERLSEYKIPKQLAVQYVKQYSTAYLDEKIRIIEFKKSRDTKIKNSGGMLRKAIEENWQPPEDLTVATEKREREIEKHERLQAEEKQAAIEKAKNRAVEEWISEASNSLIAEIRKRAAQEIRKENPETKDQFLRMLNKIRVKEIIVQEYLDLEGSNLACEQAGE